VRGSSSTHPQWNVTPKSRTISDDPIALQTHAKALAHRSSAAALIFVQPSTGFHGDFRPSSVSDQPFDIIEITALVILVRFDRFPPDPDRLTR